MKRSVVFFNLITCVFLNGMDSSIETIHVNAVLCFQITPASIVSLSSGVGFRKKDPATCAHECPVEIFTTRDTYDVNGIPITKGSAFCRKPARDNSLWASSNVNTTFHFPIKYAIYYGTRFSNQLCNCACSLVMVPNEEKNQDYKVELCADALHIEHKAPFNLKGLEHEYFKDFTYLAIRNCQKLQSTEGALDTILKTMKQLKYLDLTGSQLDKTIINVEHEKLEKFVLKNCNITDVRYIKMPNLLLLVLDYNPLPPVITAWIEVPQYCAKSFARKVT